MDTSQLLPIGLAFLAGAGAMAFVAKARRPLSFRDLEEAHQRLRQEIHDSQGRVVQAFAQGAESQGRQVQEALAMGRSEQGRHLEVMQLRLERGLELVRGTTEERLERMRQSMDERLRTSLDQRLEESFKQVSERLESVHRGLGEMASLAQDVGGLRRVLSNVKSRGILGEVQLGAMLEQFLAPGQFETQKRLLAGSREAVDFAVRLPGSDGEPVWIPIDAKFPLEDYQRLQEARDRGDQDAANRAGIELERRVLLESSKINDKYILPPHTTDFALLFVPTEGLYAEILGRPGLFDRIQRNQRVVVVGPTNLCAFLSSLQAGFASHAISQRSGEVWKVLGEVKSEFQRFGLWIQGVQAKLQAATREMDKVGVRARQMERKLQGVAEMPVSEELSFDTDRVAEGPFLEPSDVLRETESVD